MTITPQSLAAVNGVGVENQQFAVSAQVLAQKNIIIGTFDEATFTGVTPDVPFRVFSSADVGSKTGFGFMLHRLMRAAERAGIVETWIIPQLENVAGSAAAGEIDWTGTAAVLAGTLALYIAGDRIPVGITNAMTLEEVSDAVVAAINADDDLPVTAAKTAVTFETVITAKSEGTFGNDISIAFSLNDGEELPSGIVAAVTAMVGGAAIPDIQDALDALGTGDGQNEKRFTNLIHGYGADTATLDAISVYNGIGNDFVGNYKKEVARPFRSLVGDVTADTAGLTAALVLAELRRGTDRTNGMICAPGEYFHPQEIAAQAVGEMGVTNSTRAEEGYINKAIGSSHAAVADRWTNDFDNRDTAVRGGISTTFAKNGVLTLQNLVTFYRPASVAPESNGYRPKRNISIIQNMLYNYWLNFERDKWQNITIVEDVTAVADINSRLKARDCDSVIDDLVMLADAFAAKAWIYNAEYTKKNLSVTLRAGLTGFDIIFPVILSGEGGIYNTTITFDTSIAILLTGGN